MLVLVAIGALGKLDLELGCCPGWYVAFGTTDFSVCSFQRISAGGVVLHCKVGWLPAFHRMAGLTFAAIFALGKLASVRIRFMASRAQRMRHRGLEIPAAMAGAAVNRAVLAQQRESCFGMVKLRTHSSRGKLFPARGGMAGRAIFLESSMMRVCVACGTG